MTKGGKREGAGRPPSPKTRVLHSIKIEPELWAYAAAQPGKASAYIRRLIEQDRQRNDPGADER